MSDLSAEIVTLLTEPDVSGYDWSIGLHILRNWKAALPERIISLLREEIEKMENHYDDGLARAVFEEARQAFLKVLNT